jgi:Leg1
MHYLIIIFLLILTVPNVQSSSSSFPSPSWTRRKMLVSNDTTKNVHAGENDIKTFDLDQWQKGGLTSFQQTSFAEYWSNLNPESIIPLDDQQTKTSSPVDPYSFSHRMALGKYLIEHSGGEEIWGTDFTRHWYWGYLAQLDWQRRSGRLQNPAEWNAEHDLTTFQTSKFLSQEDPISKKSWWGYMNLQFSIAVYCGAAEAGLVPAIRLGKDAAVVETDRGFQQCVQQWKAFWDTHHREFLTAIQNSATETQRKAALVILYQRLWETHTNVILSGVANAKKLEALLPDEDRSVGLGWCNMVELLAAMSWTSLSLDSLCQFGVGYLPTVRIAGPETIEWIRTNRPKEYVTIQNLDKLKDTPPETMKKMCGFWSRVTRWDFQRDSMPRTLDTLSHGTSSAKILALSKILTLAVAPHSITELGVWAATGSILAYICRRK